MTEGDEPCGMAHTPEEYTVRVRFHRDVTVCVELEYPEHRTPDEAREVLAMVGEVAEIPDAVVAVTRSGHLVAEKGRA